MKLCIITALALSTLLVGATCFPLFELNPDTDTTTAARKLAVSVVKPDKDRVVKKGDSVTIAWTASNLTGSAAFATLYVRASNKEETILAGGIRLQESPGMQTYEWTTVSDVAVFSGAYTVHLRATAGEETAEGTAAGTITVNTAPTFVFTAPEADATLMKGDPDDPDDPNSPLTTAKIEISWDSFDPDSDGKAEIGLDPDTDDDDPDHDSGNEVTIYEATIPKTIGTDTLQWEGKNTEAQRVDADEYTLFARVTDAVNETQIVVARDVGGNPIRITVPEPAAASIAPDPDKDTSLIVDFDMTVKYTLNEDKDVFLDFRVDPDDNHNNGNEITIRSRVFVEKGTEEDTFEWNGRDHDGNPVGFDGKGIFKLLMLIDRGASTAQTVASDSRVILRTNTRAPAITLLEPATDVTLTGGTGGSVLIRWRDHVSRDPAKIRLAIDDDAIPNEDVETDEAEIILPSADFDDLEAGKTGLKATYRYYVSDNLAPGRYWIFAYIDRSGTAPWDDIAIAGGQIVIKDPDKTD